MRSCDTLQAQVAGRQTDAKLTYLVGYYSHNNAFRDPEKNKTFVSNSLFGAALIYGWIYRLGQTKIDAAFQSYTPP